MNTLYSYGYGGKGRITDLEAYVAAGAFILDIRYTAWSNRPEWCSDSLGARFGCPKEGGSYGWCRSLGNENYRGGPIKILYAKGGMEVLERRLSERPVVMLCGCADVETCHRQTVAELALERWPELEVRHLKPGETLDGGVLMGGLFTAEVIAQMPPPEPVILPVQGSLF